MPMTTSFTVKKICSSPRTICQLIFIKNKSYATCSQAIGSITRSVICGKGDPALDRRSSYPAPVPLYIDTKNTINRWDKSRGNTCPIRYVKGGIGIGSERCLTRHDCCRLFQIHVVKVDDAVLSSYQQHHPDRFTPDTGYYVVTNNLNQAFYIIPRLQMKHLEQTYVATHIDSDPVLELRVLRVGACFLLVVSFLANRVAICLCRSYVGTCIFLH